jgi:hypothetical protein
VVPGAIEIESPALVVTAVAVSLLLAGFALVAAIFDVREVFHQIAELRAIDEEARADASTHRQASVCCGALSTRIATGWRLAGASWRVLRADGSLMIFPVLGVAAAAVAYTGIISVGVGIADGVGVPLLVVPFLLAGVGARRTGSCTSRSRSPLPRGCRSTGATRGCTTAWPWRGHAAG